MPVYLVRHAHAGDRSKWEGPDDARPLSEKGRRQAEGLVNVLAGRPIGRVVSSPSLRCVQTVEPLADALGLKVETSQTLAEGATADDVVTLVRESVADNPVLSTHGDVIPTLLDALVRRDGLQLPDGYPCAKGSTWVLEDDGNQEDRIVRAIYLEAP